MTHGDDNGVVLPPRLAPLQVVVVPILRGDDTQAAVLAKADEVVTRLKEMGLRVKLDGRDHLSPGAKYYEWERKGVPFRVEIGPRDLEQGQLALARRLTPEGAKRKEFVPEAEAVAGMPARLDAFQTELMEAAKRRREEHTHRGVKSIGELQEILDNGGGFVYSGWSGDPAVEARIKEATKATGRVIPDEEFRSATAPEACISGEGPSKMEVVWARAY